MLDGIVMLGATIERLSQRCLEDCKGLQSLGFPREARPFFIVSGEGLCCFVLVSPAGFRDPNIGASI